MQPIGGTRCKIRRADHNNPARWQMLPPRIRSIIVSRQGGMANAHTVSDDELPGNLEDLNLALVA